MPELHCLLERIAQATGIGIRSHGMLCLLHIPLCEQGRFCSDGLHKSAHGDLHAWHIETHRLPCSLQ